MKLSIYSIEKVVFEGEIEKCIARTRMGQITILDGHIPLISFIEGGIVVMYKETTDGILSEKEIDIPIEFGFLEVRPPIGNDGNAHTEAVILVADREVASPLAPVEISHKIV